MRSGVAGVLHTLTTATAHCIWLNGQCNHNMVLKQGQEIHYRMKPDHLSTACKRNKNSTQSSEYDFGICSVNPIRRILGPSEKPLFRRLRTCQPVKVGRLRRASYTLQGDRDRRDVDNM